jgi:hypothetical protein
VGVGAAAMFRQARHLSCPGAEKTCVKAMCESPNGHYQVAHDEHVEPYCKPVQYRLARAMTRTGEFPAIVANVNAVTVAFATEAANVTLQNPAETKGHFEARVVLVHKFLPTGLADVVSPQWHCFIPPQEFLSILIAIGGGTSAKRVSGDSLF